MGKGFLSKTKLRSHKIKKKTDKSDFVKILKYLEYKRYHKYVIKQVG